MKNSKYFLVGLFVVAFSSLFAQNIIEGEYYIDTDPGQGKATPFIIDNVPNPQSTITLPTQDLDAGVHYIGIRVKNDSREWSITAVSSVRIQTAFTNIPFSRGEYFWDEDPGVGQANDLILPNVGSVNQSFDFSTNDLDPGNHVLGFRLQNQNGVWSHYATKDILVCETSPPIADFISSTWNLVAFFTDSSKHADSIFWDFGDGTTSKQVNPRHEYSDAGIYDVMLVAYGACDNDTTSKKIEFLGLRTYSPQVGVLNSTNNFEILGAFGNVTKVELHHSNGTIIEAEEFTKLGPQVLFARVNFGASEPIGDYTLIVEMDGVIIEGIQKFSLNENSGFDGEVSFRTPPVFLINKTEIGYVDVTNTSNVTAYALPVFMRLRKPFEVRIQSPAILDSIPPQSLFYIQDKYGFYSAKDTITGEDWSIAMILIPELRPGEQFTIPLQFGSSEAAKWELEVALGEPFYGPNFPQQFLDGELRTSCNFIPPCIDIVMDIMGLVPGAGCVIGALNLGCSMGNLANEAIGSLSGGDPIASNAYYDYIGNIIGALSCGEFYAIQTGQQVVNFLIDAAINTFGAGLGFVGEGNLGSGIALEKMVQDRVAANVISKLNVEAERALLRQYPQLIQMPNMGLVA